MSSGYYLVCLCILISIVHQLLGVKKKKLATYVNYAKYLSHVAAVAMVILPCIQNVMANILFNKKGISLLITTLFSYYNYCHKKIHCVFINSQRLSLGLLSFVR